MARRRLIAGFGMLVGLWCCGCSEAPRELTNSIGMKLVPIPKGSFTMGSPIGEDGADDDEGQHEVTISREYFLGATEVTQEQFEKVMGRNPSHFRNDVVPDGDSARHPVENVSWDDAVEFCERLSALPAEKAAGRVYRLPTESEWEYACRAGSPTTYSFGVVPETLGDHAWWSDNSGGTTHPVGLKKPNAWGLHDMHGNVWEWCADWSFIYPKQPTTDPAGPAGGSNRIFRGGCWFDTARYLRSADRDWNAPSLRHDILGFRVAVTRVDPRAPPSGDGETDQPRAARTPRVDPSDLAIEFTTSIGLTLTLIPEGTFTMGSPPGEEGRGDHEAPFVVTISRPFYLATTEVTQKHYEQLMGSNPSHFQKEALRDGDSSTHPVENVSWREAMEFCSRLSALPAEQAAGRVYRLPTEAEWEYACRAGTRSAYAGGEGADALLDQAWWEGNSDETTHPVGAKNANAWGLHDMHGNVWEWCLDWYGDYPQGAVTDPLGPVDGSLRVLRGGSWSAAAWSCRSATRWQFDASNRNEYLGFRVAFSVPEPGRRGVVPRRRPAPLRFPPPRALPPRLVFRAG